MSEQIAQTVANVVAAKEEPKTVAAPAAESAPQEAKPSEPQQSDDFSAKFAALSRRERQLLEREKKLKQIEEENNQKFQKATSYEDRLKKVKQNPAELDNILSEAGMTFEEYVNFKLGIESEKKELSPDEMYNQLKKEMEENFKKIEEEKLKAEEAKNTQIISDFKNDIESFITKNSDKYELINYQGDTQLVFDVIEEYYATHGEVLDIEEAANHVEKHLEDLVDGATKLKKIASKFAPKAESIQPQLESAPKIEQAFEEKKKVASPTLSNELNGSNSSTKNPVATLEESKKRAAQLLRWS